jgi:uncharacterized protein YlxW (UPF0749 family)
MSDIDINHSKSTRRSIAIEILFCISLAGIIGEVFYFTWKYNNYALYGEIKTLQSDIKESRNREDELLVEVNLLQKQISQEKYRIDVLAESLMQNSEDKKPLT